VKRAALLSVLLVGSMLASCSYLAVLTAPKKVASTERTPAALQADDLFWKTLHGGHYDDIQAGLEAETAAYLASPSDAKTAAHVGWLHIWRIAERDRLAVRPATITDEMTLSRKYFSEAVALDPADARYLGFLASATLGEASIHKDEDDTRRGYYMMLDAIKAWPEFNLFTGGYTMSAQPVASERFHEALDWQWRTLDDCTGEKVDRTTGAYGKYMPLETQQGEKRVCWNSWIAPHNFEGFFLDMGDLVVKSGDWKLGQKIYADAKLSKTYPQWPFRDALETRIRDAADNVAAFNDRKASGDDKRIMNSTSFACMACHQE
jgi:hypothetical protein